MAAPWEKYQSQPSGPWNKYAAPTDDAAPEDEWERATLLPGAVNKRTGERAWAVPGAVMGLYNSVTDAAQLPGDVYTGKQQIDDPALTGRALNFGLLASPVNPAVRSGERAIPGVARGRTAPPAVPSEAALKKASGQGFQEFYASGANIRPETMQAFSRLMRRELDRKGLLPTNAKSTHELLKKFHRAPEGGFVSPADLHSFRQALGEIAGDFANPKDQVAATRAIETLDEFFKAMPEEGFVAGTRTEAIKYARKAFSDARANWAGAMRSGKITGRVAAAELRSQAANSGRNLDNAIRQRLAGIPLNEAQKRGFTKEELAKIESVVEGSWFTNRVRDTANLLGGGGGLGALHSAAAGAGTMFGASGGNPAATAFGAVVPPLVGWGAKKLENSLTRRAADAAARATRARTPLAQSIPPTAAYPLSQDLMMRGLEGYLLQNPDSL